MLQAKYHVRFGGSRTTITVDTILSDMMAIRLGEIPRTQDAHAAVRRWLQDTIVSHLGETSGRKSASQFARQYLIEAVVDKTISSKWNDWRLGTLE